MSNNKHKIINQFNRTLFAVSGALAIVTSGATLKDSIDMRKSYSQIETIHKDQESLLDSIQSTNSYKQWFKGLSLYLDILESQGQITPELKKEILSSKNIREYIYTYMSTLDFVDNKFKQQFAIMQSNLEQECSNYEQYVGNRNKHVLASAGSMGLMTMFYILQKYKKKENIELNQSEYAYVDYDFNLCDDLGKEEMAN